MRDEPEGIPSSGPMNRILASHFETQPGADYESDCGTTEECKGWLRGQLQPYAIYVPSARPPREGYGMTLLMHSLAANYNQYLGSNNQSQLGDRGPGSIVITPAGRGPDGWYYDHAGADTFEVWADVAKRYKLDPRWTTATGYSMGGYGTFKFATQFPDLFAKAQTTVGPPGLGFGASAQAPVPGGPQSSTYFMLPSVRNVPFLMWVGDAGRAGPDHVHPGAEAALRRPRLPLRLLAVHAHRPLRAGDQRRVRARRGLPGHHRGGPQPLARDLRAQPDDGLLRRGHHRRSRVLARRHRAARRQRGCPSWHDRRALGGLWPGRPAGRSTLSLVAGRSPAATSALSPTRASSRSGATRLTPPRRNRLVIDAENISTVTVNVERARVNCNVDLDVETDGPLTVRLKGCSRIEQFDGAP